MSEATSDSKARPVLTLRVSHDGGKTWGDVREYREGENLAPLVSSVWPLCQCPRCVGKNR